MAFDQLHADALAEVELLKLENAALRLTCGLPADTWAIPALEAKARAAGWADAIKALRNAAEALKRDWGLATEDMNVDVLLRHLLEAVAARAIESDQTTTQDGA